jgi:hypothetical protein
MIGFSENQVKIGGNPVDSKWYPANFWFVGYPEVIHKGRCGEIGDNPPILPVTLSISPGTVWAGRQPTLPWSPRVSAASCVATALDKKCQKLTNCAPCAFAATTVILFIRT